MGTATRTSASPEPPGSARPPRASRSPVRWARENLFPNWWNSLLTLLVTPLLGWVIFRTLRFAFVTGRWEIVEVNLASFMVGGFPRGELWRLWVGAGVLGIVVGLGVGITATASREAAIAAGRELRTPWHEPLRRLGPPAALIGVLIVFVRTATPIVLLAALVAVSILAYRLGRRIPHDKRRLVNLAVLAGVVVAMVVITGFGGVPTEAWGGFLLTAYFTIGTLVIAFPIGLAVALGRRSTLPVVRGVCAVYVEFFRGAPLVALLFMGWLVLGFFLPAGVSAPGLITRALIIFILFTSAYVAEIVRGGLQGIPRGQWEAARALGLSPWKQVRLVVMPQALRSVIPALVGQAISLYKDTTLVFIIGLTDLLRVSRIITAQERFLGQGLFAETLVFAGLIYWVGSYWMSRESQRLEKRLGVGER